ncbi:hypothetical protein [Stutzerimonas stutzeri]|uniref:hypothetical protein n=1 Tax=Stutzerimonas stutzeri TaxID=316 RepID=UPI001E5EBBDD|nr:hypothetical protein [Stutzerimonas stutzeri]
MPTSLFDQHATAAVLLKAWRSGELLTLLPAELKPETLEQGYDAQDELFKLAGGTQAGWKLGVGSPAAMRAAKLSRPLVGQLERARLHPPVTLRTHQPQRKPLHDDGACPGRYLAG